jgi:hypothetical protein
MTLFKRNAPLNLNGHGHPAAVPVVPQSLLKAAVTADTGSVASSYDMSAAFMSSQHNAV